MPLTKTEVQNLDIHLNQYSINSIKKARKNQIDYMKNMKKNLEIKNAYTKKEREKQKVLKKKKKINISLF